MSHRPVVSRAPRARREAERGASPRAGRAAPSAAGRGFWFAGGLAGACLTAFAGSTAVQAAEFERSFTYSADRLTVTTLVGSVRVERATGSQMQVTVNVRGQDADQKWIKFESSEGKDARLVVQFPVKEYHKYVYPKMGNGSRTSFSIHDGHHGDDNWFEDLLDLATGDRLEVRGSSFSGAIELWTDVIVKVPDSKRASARLGVGQIEAESVKADLELRVRSGPVDATDITGALDIGTGSGSVDARRVKGELALATGSGSVHVEDVSGGRAASVETGSGSVSASAIRAEELTLDTGSGGVDLDDIDVKSLRVETGSGGVDGNRVGANDVKIDTGSGGVELELVRMGRGRYDVETGSGGIRFGMPEPVSAEFDVETGSGSIVADLDGVNLDRRNRREAHFTMGDGEARVTLSTGSGSVRLSQSAAPASKR